MSDHPVGRQGSIEFAPERVDFLSRISTALVGLAVVTVSVTMTYGWWSDDVTGPDYVEDALTAERLRPLRVVPINTDLPMGDTSPYRWLASDGFRDSEADGVWVMAPTARLVFEVESFDEPAQLNLSLAPLVSRDKTEREVTVSSRAGSVTVTLTDGGEVVRVPLDGALDQEVTISCPDLDSPKDLGLGDDIRDLCVKVFNLVILTEERISDDGP